MGEVDFAAIKAAAERLRGYAHRTPVLTCASLDALAAARLYFKCENFQRAGAFKFRGAWNAVASLTAEEARRGVVTHSSGNHAAALALAARLAGIPAFVVMPEDASKTKRDAVIAFGAALRLCAPSLAAREDAAAALAAETGARFVHPYDDERVIAGQGTAALELLEDVPELDLILAPVSGGGLLSGTALAARALSPAARIIGVEPEDADDAARSLRSGRLQPAPASRTVADGLRAALSPRTFAILRAHVDAIVTVSDREILAAQRLVLERMKILIEPSAAAPVAAILSDRVAIAGRHVGVILSGGNVDLERLRWDPADA